MVPHVSLSSGDRRWTGIIMRPSGRTGYGGTSPSTAAPSPKVTPRRPMVGVEGVARLDDLPSRGPAMAAVGRDPVEHPVGMGQDGLDGIVVASDGGGLNSVLPIPLEADQPVLRRIELDWSQMPLQPAPVGQSLLAGQRVRQRPGLPVVRTAPQLRPGGVLADFQQGKARGPGIGRMAAEDAAEGAVPIRLQLGMEFAPPGDHCGHLGFSGGLPQA